MLYIDYTGIAVSLISSLLHHTIYSITQHQASLSFTANIATSSFSVSGAMKDSDCFASLNKR